MFLKFCKKFAAIFKLGYPVAVTEIFLIGLCVRKQNCMCCEKKSAKKDLRIIVVKTERCVRAKAYQDEVVECAKEQ